MDLDPMTDGSLRKLSDEKIQDFIDGRLSRRERAVVAATLIANPDLMHEVMRLWLINEMLRCLGQDALLEQVPDLLKHALKSTNPPRGE
jgi:anti-sigma factor RsiW